MATTPTLRPLGVGEILDAGIKIYLRHWKPLMICVVGIVLPVRILSVLVVASVDPDSLGLHFDTTSSTSTASGGAAVAAVLVVAVASLFSSLAATAACFKAVADAWLGAMPEAGRSLRFAVRRVPALFALLLIAWLALIPAFVALVIPGVWLLVSWALAVPALLFERIGPVKALRRSFRLVRTRWWATLGTLVIGYFLASVVGTVFQLIPLSLASALAGHSTVAAAFATVIGGTLSSMITMPYTAAILTLLYFDQRVRKEGFDLQLLAEGLGSERDPDAPLPAPLVGPDVTPEQRAAAPYWPPPPGWTPPEPSAPEPSPAEPGRPAEWWRDPAPSGPDLGGFTPPQAPDGSPPPAAAADEPPPEPPKRDPKRADWLPPEAPRGPGGL